MRFINLSEQGRFIGVVVITSASHAEGPGFDPQMNLVFFIFFIYKDCVVVCTYFRSDQLL